MEKIRIGSETYSLRTYNWERDCTWNNVEGPTYPAEKFRRRFAKSRALYKELKHDLLHFELCFGAHS